MTNTQPAVLIPPPPIPPHTQTAKTAHVIGLTRDGLSKYAAMEEQDRKRVEMMAGVRTLLQEFTQDFSRLAHENAVLRNENEALRNDNAARCKEIAELEEQLAGTTGAPSLDASHTEEQDKALFLRYLSQTPREWYVCESGETRNVPHLDIVMQEGPRKRVQSVGSVSAVAYLIFGVPMASHEEWLKAGFYHVPGSFIIDEAEITAACGL